MGINTNSYRIRLNRTFCIWLLLAVVLDTFSNHSYAQGDSPEVYLTMHMAVTYAQQYNPLIKILELKDQQALTQQKMAIQFNPAEINYKTGQLYSSSAGHYFEINQNFGSILVHIQSIKQYRVHNSIVKIESQLAKKELLANVKSAYSFWQFQFIKTQILNEEREEYERLKEISEARYKSGDISLLEKSTASTKASQASNNYFMATDNLTISRNKLVQLIGIDSNYFPTLPEPEIYMIEKSSDTAATEGNIYSQYYRQQIAFVKAEQLVKQSTWAPQIKAGFFSQQVNGLSGLYGWQIGIAIPLWFPQQQASLKNARIETEIMQQQMQYNDFVLHSQIENLIFELTRYFRLIRYYEDQGLQEADLLSGTAQSQLEKEEISYDIYLQSITMANKIKIDYYESINEYNQTAIQLEIYGNE